MNVYAIVATGLLASSMGISAAPLIQDDHASEPHLSSVLPALPEAALELLAARPFVLELPYSHEWRSEQPEVRAGYVLVLRVNPAVVYPRQSAEPVLYVGKQTAEKVNLGYPSGKLVVIVPAPLKADGSVDLDLEKSPIWFGSPALPEQIDASEIIRQADIAARQGIRPFKPDAIEMAARRGGEILRANDRNGLFRSMAVLVRAHSPQETELVESMERQGL